jgi:hypothetical protein
MKLPATVSEGQHPSLNRSQPENMGTYRQNLLPPMHPHHTSIPAGPHTCTCRATPLRHSTCLGRVVAGPAAQLAAEAIWLPVRVVELR